MIEGWLVEGQLADMHGYMHVSMHGLGVERGRVEKERLANTGTCTRRAMALRLRGGGVVLRLRRRGKVEGKLAKAC